MTKIKYNNKLLTHCLNRDRATLIGNFDSPNRDIKITFLCNCGKEHIKTFRQIYKTGALCKTCTSKFSVEKRNNTNEVKIANSDNSFASCDKSIYLKDKSINPIKIAKYSSKKYEFTCPNCKHDFISTISNVSNGHWCPYCANKKLCEIEDCNKCFNNSFASCDKAIYLKDKSKNPRKIAKYSHDEYEFTCNTCDHDFKARIQTVSNGHWCPYCTNTERCEENCKQCYNNSFASSDKAQYLKDKSINPRKIAKRIDTKHEFTCPDCNHDFKLCISSITDTDHPQWCPYCCKPHRKRCEIENCKHCFHNSFASCDKSIYLKDKSINPRKIAKYSMRKHKFTCPDCNYDFESIISNVSRGSWCGKCKYKTEKQIFDFLSLSYKVQREIKFDFCKNPKTNQQLPFDFVIEENKIIIELDGRQHFVQVSNWNSPENTQLRDIYKMKCANKNGYKIIRLVQEEVFNNLFDWKTELTQALKSNDYIVYLSKDKIIYKNYSIKFNEHLIDNF